MKRSTRKALRTLIQGVVAGPAAGAVSAFAGAPSRAAFGTAAATVGFHSLAAWAQNGAEDKKKIPTILPSPAPGKKDAPLVKK